MRILRQKYVTRFLSLFTGVVFLNMSFFLAEVSMLSLNDKQLIENIARLISNSGFEEEKEGQSSCDDVAKEVDLMIVHQAISYHTSLVLIFSRTNRELINHYPHTNYAQTFFTPPDASNFS